MVGSVKICPNCGSTEWTFVSSQSAGMKLFLLWGRAAQQDIVECRDCGFMGILPEVVRDRISEFQKHIKEKKSIE